MSFMNIFSSTSSKPTARTRAKPIDVVAPQPIPTWPAYYHQHLSSNPPQPDSCVPTLLSTHCPNTTQLPAPSAVVNGVVKLWQGDITALRVGAVVNAANSGMWAGGGICGAIHSAAGRDLEAECERFVAAHGDVPTGETLVTGAYRLPADFVFHTVGPKDGSWEKLSRSVITARTQRCPQRQCAASQPRFLSCCQMSSSSLLCICAVSVYRCYRTCLDLLLQRQCRSIAFCCISTGIFGFPNLEAAICALQTVRQWLDEDERHRQAVDCILFCVFLDKDKLIYERHMPLFFPLTQPELEGKVEGTAVEAAQDGSGGVEGDGASEDGGGESKKQRVEQADGQHSGGDMMEVNRGDTVWVPVSNTAPEATQSVQQSSAVNARAEEAVSESEQPARSAQEEGQLAPSRPPLASLL